ncbi:MFS transporter [Streptomyces sp. NPDC002018]|uniref:MFS transporter n=1 Tax=Streptomyces sp. NPDC002018 TaxID=3364629 RepID=UPI003692245F
MVSSFTEPVQTEETSRRGNEIVMAQAQPTPQPTHRTAQRPEEPPGTGTGTGAAAAAGPGSRSAQATETGTGTGTGAGTGTGTGARTGAGATIVHAPAPPHPAATLAVTSAATTVALMNYTAPLLTLPSMTAAFGTPLSGQAWLLNGAPLGLAAVLLIAGSLADDFGRRRIFLLGTLALGITTALGGLTDSTLLFTLARVAQGAASAAIIASSLGLLVHAFPAGPARIKATGVWGAFVSAGIALGPLLAGGLNGLNGSGWRLTYGVLAAAALVTAGFAVRALTESRAARRNRPDVPGALALALAFTALLSALTLGRDGWLRAPVLLLLLAAVVLVALFAVVERRTAAPLFDLGLLRRPLFGAASTGALFTGLAVIGLMSYLPSLLQQTIHMSALGAAWLFLLWSGTAFLVALQVRRLSGRVAARHQLALGFVLHTAGALGMLGALDAGSWVRLVPGLFVAGVGSGLLNAALPRLSVESVPAKSAAMGSGANNTARYLGSSAGVALIIAVATSVADPAHGTDLAMLVSAGLTLLGAAAVLALRERRGQSPTP